MLRNGIREAFTYAYECVDDPTMATFPTQLSDEGSANSYRADTTSLKMQRPPQEFLVTLLVPA